MGSNDSHLVAAARPALAVAGQVDTALAGRLVELLVQEDLHGLCRCEALFNNWGQVGNGSGFLYFDRRTLDFGKQLEVRLGDSAVFDGRISALQAEFAGPEAQLRVLAEDRLQDLRMTRRSRGFADLDDAAVFRQIAQDHGLTPELDLAGPTHALLAQLNQSDLAFLRERARAIGAELRLRGTTLHAARRSSSAAGAPTLTLGAELSEFRVLADLGTQATAVVVDGWDVAGKQAIHEQADGNSMASEIGNDESGAALLRNAFGERRQTLAHAVPLSADEATALARARFAQQARRFVVGQGVAAADPALQVGGRVKLQGLGPLFNGFYSVVATRLRFDARHGLRTEFRAERAGLGRP